MDKAAQTAARVLEEIQGVQSPQGFLIRSSLTADAEWAAVRNAQGHAKARLRREYDATTVRQDECWRAALNAATRGDIAYLSEVIGNDASGNDMWWCDSQASAHAVLTELYRQLLTSRNPHDAYDYGLAGAVVCLHLWRD